MNKKHRAWIGSVDPYPDKKLRASAKQLPGCLDVIQDDPDGRTRTTSEKVAVALDWYKNHKDLFVEKSSVDPAASVNQRITPDLIDSDPSKNHFINKNFPIPDEQFTGKGFRDISSASSPTSLETSDVLDEGTDED